jgi:mRNA interferase RelE/StbE
MPKAGKIYRIRIAQDAAEFIRAQTKKVQRQLIKKIDTLAQSPRTQGTPLKNGGDLRRVRTGDYRIVYQIRKRELVVAVVTVGHRKDVYKLLKRLGWIR